MGTRESERDDPWAVVVIGFPAYIRHHSGTGFKPILRFPYDFNMPLDWGNDGRESLLTKWHDGNGELDDARVGDSIFVYTEDDHPPFGFLATITEIAEDRLFIDLDYRPRFDAYVTDDEWTSHRHAPKGWSPGSTTWRCAHMTVAGPFTSAPRCGACSDAMTAS